MTQVCLVGDDEYDLRYELLSRETARDALATYAIEQPYANTVAVETVSLGAAVALLNDLNWYLTRFARTAFVREPSIDAAEWLSRALATAIRDGEIAPEASGRYLRMYGVTDDDPPALVEPMYVARTGSTLPEYDLRAVSDTLVVRVTEAEFGG